MGSAHCTLCHQDFVPVMSGNGGHACPMRPTDFADARLRFEEARKIPCATCDAHKVVVQADRRDA